MFKEQWESMQETKKRKEKQVTLLEAFADVHSKKAFMSSIIKVETVHP